MAIGPFVDTRLHEEVRRCQRERRLYGCAQPVWKQFKLGHMGFLPTVLLESAGGIEELQLLVEAHVGHPVVSSVLKQRLYGTTDKKIQQAQLAFAGAIPARLYGRSACGRGCHERSGLRVIE